MPAHPEVRFTCEDYLATPEDSSKRYEIMDGALFVTAAPRARHQEVVTRLGARLLALADAHELGKELARTDPDVEYQPGPVGGEVILVRTLGHHREK